MAHPLVLQLRFTRSEFKRAVAGWLDALTTERFQYHRGENMAVLKILGHTGLRVFVGDIDHEAPYTPGSDG